MNRDELAARGVKVRALIWSSDPRQQDNDSDQSALSPFGRYYAQSGALYWGPSVIVSTGYPNIEVAKAAAQADYEARILATLEVVE